MELKDRIETLNAVESKGAFGFVAVTNQEANVKSRVTKLPTPANLLVVTKYTATTVSLGNDYESAVNRRLTQEGKAADFKAQSTYCAPVAANKLVYKHHERDSWYLRVYPDLCVSFKTVVVYRDLNGADITAQWSELQKHYFKQPSKNESQGLDRPVIVLNYGLENVLYLKRGEVILDLLTAEITRLADRSKRAD